MCLLVKINKYHVKVNFGVLAAEIVSLVWGTPVNFNGFRVLAALLHSSIGRQPNFAAMNIGRHLYSAERPSSWASAHILVIIIMAAHSNGHAIIFYPCGFYLSSFFLSYGRPTE